MWITIIIIAALAIIAAASYAHQNEIKNRIKNEGGMLKKYAELVDGLMKDDPGTQIFKTTGNIIVLGISNPYASILFSIKQDVETVTVEYILKLNHENTKRRLAWEFPEDLDQTKMMNNIRFDIASDNLKMRGLIN